MTETVSLLTAVISMIAGVIGTAVSVAQWRHARREEDKIAPPRPRTVAGRPGQPRLARTTAVALILGAITAFFATGGEIVFWVQQSAGSGEGAEWEPVLDIALGGGLLASAATAATALFAIIAGLFTRSSRDIWRGLLALALSLTIWIALWLTDLIKDVAN